MTSLAWQHTSSRLAQFLALTKPRVVSLIVFCAVIGMFLAVPFGAINAHFAATALAATLGIALVAGAAAAINCLVEQKIDALMARTRSRPLPRGQLTSGQTLAFALLVGGGGLALLYYEVNVLTMWLTFATFVGYAIVYTVVLKPMTPQNIVIGGASGAMPPVLGWAAVSGDISYQALLLFLIIFAWTPPHFWALALYRKHEYAKAGVPMLPVTHGDKFTQTSRLALYRDPGRRDIASVCHAHERTDLSDRGGRAGCGFPLLRGQNILRLQRSSRAPDIPLLDHVFDAVVCGTAGRPLLRVTIACEVARSPYC